MENRFFLPFVSFFKYAYDEGFISFLVFRQKPSHLQFSSPLPWSIFCLFDKRAYVVRTFNCWFSRTSWLSTSGRFFWRHFVREFISFLILIRPERTAYPPRKFWKVFSTRLRFGFETVLSKRASIGGQVFFNVWCLRHGRIKGTYNDV